MMLKLYCSDFG